MLVNKITFVGENEKEIEVEAVIVNDRIYIIDREFGTFVCTRQQIHAGIGL